MAVATSVSAMMTWIATTGVDLRSDRFQVIRVHAMADTTKMVKGEAVRDWPTKSLIHNSVDKARVPQRAVYSAVPIGVDPTRPLPTIAGRIYPVGDGRQVGSPPPRGE